MYKKNNTLTVKGTSSTLKKVLEELKAQKLMQQNKLREQKECTYKIVL